MAKESDIKKSIAVWLKGTIIIASIDKKRPNAIKSLEKMLLKLNFINHLTKLNMNLY